MLGGNLNDVIAPGEIGFLWLGEIQAVLERAKAVGGAAVVVTAGVFAQIRLIHAVLNPCDCRLAKNNSAFSPRRC